MDPIPKAPDGEDLLIEPPLSRDPPTGWDAHHRPRGASVEWAGPPLVRRARGRARL